MRNVPFNRRSTIRSLAYAIDIPRSTLFRILKEGTIKRINSTLKPLLTPTNKIARLQFSLKFVRPNGLFHDMYDYVHIDEKWFYITKVKKKYYLLSDEEPPERSTKSKRYITKVMFMAAVARSQWDPNRGCYFDRKIGIWSFIVQEPAKRASKNRPRGDMVTKAVTSVYRAMIKEMITEKIMPAIRQKCPVEDVPAPFLFNRTTQNHTPLVRTFHWYKEVKRKDGIFE